MSGNKKKRFHRNSEISANSGAETLKRVPDGSDLPGKKVIKGGFGQQFTDKTRSEIVSGIGLTFETDPVSEKPLILKGHRVQIPGKRLGDPGKMRGAP